METALVQHLASQADASWLGCQVMVGKHLGYLSDVTQHPLRRRTVLWMGGDHVTVRSSAVVITEVRA